MKDSGQSPSRQASQGDKESHTAERKLLQAEMLLQSEIAKNIAEGIYLVSAKDLTIVYANPKMEDMFGYGPGEMNGRHVSILNAPNGGDPVQTARQIEKSLRERGVWRGEVLNARKDGTPFWGLASVSLLHHPEHGDIYLSLQTDITDRKRIEEELRSHREALGELVCERTKELKRVVSSLIEEINSRKSAENALSESEAGYRRISQEFHTLLDAITDSLVVVSPDLKVLWANKSAAAGLGMAEQDLIERHCHELWFGRSASCEDCYALRTFASGLPDGSTIATPRGRLIDVRSFPIHGSEGTVEKVLIVGQDITEKRAREAEHRRTKEELVDSEQRYRVMIEHSNDLIWMLDREGRFSYFNTRVEEVGGYRIGEWFGKNFLEMIPEPDLPRIRDIFADVLKGKSRYFEADVIRQDGSLFTLYVNTIPFLIKGQVVGTLSFGRDITDQKRAERELELHYKNLELLVRERTRELEAAYKDMETFSYAVSHDLRAPLRRIRDFSNLLVERSREKLDGEDHEMLSRIVNNTKKMGQLIEDLLTFSRLSNKEIAKSEIDMERLSGNASGELQAGLGERTISVEIKKMPLSFGDPSMVYQVLLNMLSNALKFTRGREDARIEMGGYAGGDECVYYVKDNGIGFDMQFSDRLFGLFQRIHTSEKYEGTGIGLVIVKKIVEKHGGRVWAEGRPDGGATFYFSLPGQAGPLNHGK